MLWAHHRPAHKCLAEACFAGTSLSVQCVLFSFSSDSHAALERALDELNRDDKGTVRDAARWNVAESLIVMGVDPTVSAVCGAVTELTGAAISPAPARYAPTSFVSRRSIGSFSNQGHPVSNGDVLYLSLVKPRDAQIDTEETSSVNSRQTSPAISFGAGPHMCLGRAFALSVCDVAEDAYQQIGTERPIRKMWSHAEMGHS